MKQARAKNRRRQKELKIQKYIHHLRNPKNHDHKISKFIFRNFYLEISNLI
jgi:hypothetical protein